MTTNKEGLMAIELKGVSFAYGGTQIFDKADLMLVEGQIFGIVGLSGSGKTTLIRLINGAILREHQHAYTGDILLFGKNIRDIEHVNKLVGTIYQDVDNQIVFTSVVDEIVFGMENYGLSKATMTQRLKSIVSSLGIEHLLDKNPNQLSGGEKQLVVLASVLCLESKILILDEPMTAVDRETRKVIVRIIGELKAKGVTVIIIEHDYHNLVMTDQVFKLEGQKITQIQLG